MKSSDSPLSMGVKGQANCHNVITFKIAPPASAPGLSITGLPLVRVDDSAMTMNAVSYQRNVPFS